MPLPSTSPAFWETSSCGLDLRFPCPSSPDEYDRKAGYVGATVADAIRYTGLHSTLPEWQEKFVQLAEETFGIPRAVDENATAKKLSFIMEKNRSKVPPVYEPAKKYVARLLATLSPEDKLRLKALAQTVAEANPVDPSPAARRGAISAENMRLAESLLAAPPDHYEATISRYSEYVGGFILDRNGGNLPTTESLARLIQTYRRRRDEETQAELAMAD